MAMLDPHDRRLLLDALRPPDDFTLDFAVGTTFSLDLLALLTAPLGFTRFELQETDGTNIVDADAHLVLRTLREYADKISIFCQAGRIAVPPGHRPLLSMLERMVIQVVPPTPKRVFHPKVWALRFSGPEGAVSYRLLVLSRNLTFAKSWDTALILDGVLQDRANNISANRPLGEFFGALPAMTRPRLSDIAAARVDQLQEESRKVKFDCPADITELSFHPLGIPGVRDRTFESGVRRLLIISPFLSAAKLAELTERGRGDVLVSRLDSLEKLSARDLSNFSKVYALNPSAAAGAEEDAATERDPLTESAGLHAKCYVADDGYSAHIWTGSANATNAAFGGNVELLVRLTGSKSRFGIDALLSPLDQDVGFANLLTPYRPASEVELDPIDEQLDELLEQARSAIAQSPWIASVMSREGGSHSLQLGGYDGSPDELDDVSVYPITLGKNRELDASEAGLIWEDVSTEGITSFFAFEVTRRVSKRSRSCRFVLNVTLEGAPANRNEVLLRSMLRDRGQLIRFLLLLLGDTGDDPAAWRQALDSGLAASAGLQVMEAQALLEPLLRALERDPSRLDHVDRLLRDLGVGSTEDGAVPDGLSEIFGPIWEARKRIG